jgi:hypothetical protein
VSELRIWHNSYCGCKVKFGSLGLKGEVCDLPVCSSLDPSCHHAPLQRQCTPLLCVSAQRCLSRNFAARVPPLPLPRVLRAATVRLDLHAVLPNNYSSAFKTHATALASSYDTRKALRLDASFYDHWRRRRLHTICLQVDRSGLGFTPPRSKSQHLIPAHSCCRRY